MDDWLAIKYGIVELLVSQFVRTRDKGLVMFELMPLGKSMPDEPQSSPLDILMVVAFGPKPGQARYESPAHQASMTKALEIMKRIREKPIEMP
jgi:hypothetical protein